VNDWANSETQEVRRQPADPCMSCGESRREPAPQRCRQPGAHTHATPVIVNTYDGGPLPVESSLHWLQIIAYVVVILTCLLVTYSIIDVYMALHHLQEELHSLTNGFGG
jgi:hypothetical protein